jgi:hypothetical protein
LTIEECQGDSGGFVQLDRARFFAFVASAAIWIVGIWLGLGITPVLALMATAYVVPGSLALALAGERTGEALAGLWGCAVALVAVIAIPVAGSVGTVAGLLFGTLSFGVWMSSGFLLLDITRNRRTRTVGSAARIGDI